MVFGIHFPETCELPRLSAEKIFQDADGPRSITPALFLIQNGQCICDRVYPPRPVQLQQTFGQLPNTLEGLNHNLIGFGLVTPKLLQQTSWGHFSAYLHQQTTNSHKSFLLLSHGPQSFLERLRQGELFLKHLQPRNVLWFESGKSDAAAVKAICQKRGVFGRLCTRPDLTPSFLDLSKVAGAQRVQAIKDFGKIKSPE